MSVEAPASIGSAVTSGASSVSSVAEIAPPGISLPSVDLPSIDAGGFASGGKNIAALNPFEGTTELKAPALDSLNFDRTVPGKLAFTRTESIWSAPKDSPIVNDLKAEIILDEKSAELKVPEVEILDKISQENILKNSEIIWQSNASILKEPKAPILGRELLQRSLIEKPFEDVIQVGKEEQDLITNTQAKEPLQTEASRKINEFESERLKTLNIRQKLLQRLPSFKKDWNKTLNLK